MRPWVIVFAMVVVVSAAVTAAWVGAAENKKEKPMLAHDVYFSLTDASPAAQKQLVDACRKYLSGHPGTVWFSTGMRAPEFTRDVNILDFDVALHVVFKDKASHDQYQKADRHAQFIKESEANWKQVRVFDSYVEGVPRE